VSKKFLVTDATRFVSVDLVSATPKASPKEERENKGRPFKRLIATTLRESARTTKRQPSRERGLAKQTGLFESAELPKEQRVARQRRSVASE